MDSLNNLHNQIERLNHAGGLSYRIMLGGLLATYGRDVIAKELNALYSDNVVSIARAKDWCQSTAAVAMRRAR
jgi:hypothetical protein